MSQQQIVKRPRIRIESTSDLRNERFEELANQSAREIFALIGPLRKRLRRKIGIRQTETGVGLLPTLWEGWPPCRPTHHLWP